MRENVNNRLMSIEEINEIINSGKTLLIAGDEKVLVKLNKGKWIGGTIPYFMDVDGGVITQEKCFITILPDYLQNIEIISYSVDTIKNIYVDSKPNGVSFIIIPAQTAIHLNFAINSPSYEKFGSNPLIGWISGILLSDLGKATAKVMDGRNSLIFDDKAIVIHASLPDSKYAEIDIVNIFVPGSGDEISFFEDSFSVKEALINGVKRNFADYLREIKHDTRFPLVADYLGAMINISYQSIDELNKIVNFYAPVFKGQIYHNAEKLEDYVSKFEAHMPKDDIKHIAFSCNCILNFLYSELEGKKTEGITGPITFGEIGYQLLNQTLAYITIKDYKDDD
jgi:hypothetical protein